MTDIPVNVDIMNGASCYTILSKQMDSRRPVFVLSQPKAGTYLMANILLELGYTGGPDGIMHISNGKYETYPYPGTPGFYRARTDPNSVRTEMHWYKSLDLIKKPNHFAVGHISWAKSPHRFADFDVILLTRPLKKIKESLDRWDEFSGRGASDHDKVLELAEQVGNWRSRKDMMPIFEITYDDMRNCNVERIDELQEFLKTPKKDSKTVVENALARDSVTKVS